MDLFNTLTDSTTNLLPEDGTVYYFGKIFSRQESNKFSEVLFNNIQWKNDQSFMYGKLIITRRKVAWYGDNDYHYTYSKITRKALPWTAEMSLLKSIIEEKTKENYNSCLLNLYHNGNEGMGWHSDAEKELKKNGAIASISFGAERKFEFKHKTTGEKISLMLEHGSLLLMKDNTQINWLHQLPVSKKITTPRINLTFRTIML